MTKAVDWWNSGGKTTKTGEKHTEYVTRTSSEDFIYIYTNTGH